MRRLVIILLAIGVIISLPRVADKFRGERFLLRSEVSESPGPAHKDTDEKLQAVASVPAHAPQNPDAAKAALPPPPPSNAAEANGERVKSAGAPPAPPAVPLARDELIAEIGKELTRLGLYDGPVTKVWTKPVRRAAREYAQRAGLRSRQLQPTQEFLQALRSDRQFAEKRNEQEPKLPALNAQVAIQEPEGARGAAPEPVKIGAQAAAKRDLSYLPPQMGAAANEGDSAAGGKVADAKVASLNADPQPEQKAVTPQDETKARRPASRQVERRRKHKRAKGGRSGPVFVTWGASPRGHAPFIFGW